MSNGTLTNDPVQNAKVRASRAVRNAIRGGRLTRLPCEVCAKTPTHAHHDDYSKPLDVRWLCSLHHGHAHRPTHCIHGHEFTPANTYITHRGRRSCRTCNRTHQATYKRRRKEMVA